MTEPRSIPQSLKAFWVGESLYAAVSGDHALTLAKVDSPFKDYTK